MGPHQSSRPAMKPISIAPRATDSRSSIEAGKDSVKATLSTGESTEVLLYGATVTSWITDNGKVENLWLSKDAVLDGSKPVRGGIPLVFPIFGPPPKDKQPHGSLPQHGFARNSVWELLSSSSSESTESDESVTLVFGLYSTALSEQIRQKWSQDFGLVYTVVLTQKSLRTILSVKNTGDKTLEFQTLFHTYFRVPDVNTTRVTGLGAASYHDKLLDTKSDQKDHELKISGPIDRVYTTKDHSSIVSINDAKSGKSCFDIERHNLPNVVVWNPWKEGANAMSDFGPKGDAKDGYVNMLCVEAGKVDDWVKIEPGEEWEAYQVIKSHL